MSLCPAEDLESGLADRADRAEVPEAPRKGVSIGFQCRETAAQVERLNQDGDEPSQAQRGPKKKKLRREGRASVEDAGDDKSVQTGDRGDQGDRGNRGDRADRGDRSDRSDAGERAKKPAKEEETKVSSLLHGKFTTDGRVQEFVYIPTDQVSDIASKSSELFENCLRHWNLPRPQLLIKFQSGFAHPKHLLAKSDIEKLQKNCGPSGVELYKYFKHFRNFALRQQREKGSELAEHLDPDVPNKEIDEKALKLLNEFLFKSLSNLIDVIVRAAVRNRCWILVEGGPTGGLLLLKHAAERMKEKPVILVMNSLKHKRFPYKEVDAFIRDRNSSGKESKVVTLEELMMMSGGKLKEAIKEVVEAKAESEMAEIAKKEARQRDDASGKRRSQMSKKSIKSTGTERSEEEEKSRWDLADQKELEELKVKAALMTTRLLKHAKPIDVPDMDPLKLGMDFWNLKLEKEGWPFQSSKEKQSGKVRWNNWHFRGGTHYIFSDDHIGEVVTDCLAPCGCIFLGGGDGSKKELIKMLINGEPVVCLNNTGRLTQDFVRCHEYFCSTLFREEDEKEDFKARKRLRFQRTNRSESLEDPVIPKKSKERTDYLRDNIARKSVFARVTFDGEDGVEERENLVIGMKDELDQVTSFTQPELCELFLTYLRRGLQITKLCVVMDPLNPRECSGGHTEDKLSMCLSNFVILASNDTSDFADVEAVKAASKLEAQLLWAAGVERWWALLMTYMLLVLNFLSLLLALARNSSAPYFLTWLPAIIKRWGLPGVSAASTFISGLMGRFRFTLRWSKSQSAAAQLQAEIWKFRTRVSDYVVVGAGGDEDGRPGDGQIFTRERKQDVTRSLFRANVTNIFNSAMEEMGTSSLHGGAYDSLPNSMKQQRKLRPVCCCGRKRGKLPEESQDLGNKKDAPNQADLTQYGHLGVDDYYQQRTLDVFGRMKQQAFWLTFKQGGLESMVLLFGTFGVLLSTFDQTELAMICLSLAASLQSLEKFHALSTRLDAANAGERDMICAWQEWSAMEPMQRRFQSNVNRLVLTTEGVNVALTSAATAGVRQSLATKPN